jgi:hypothetical protein
LLRDLLLRDLDNASDRPIIGAKSDELPAAEGGGEERRRRGSNYLTQVWVVFT